MPVRSLRTALGNLDEEASFIAADDSVAARLVVARLVEAVAQRSALHYLKDDALALLP